MDQELAPLTEEEIGEIHAAFKKFDTKYDGYISRKDFVTVMHYLGQSPNGEFTDAEANDILKEVDPQGFDRIQFHTLRSFMEHYKMRLPISKRRGGGTFDSSDQAEL